MTDLNHSGLAKAHSLVAAGKVNNGEWSFSGEDGDKLLGSAGDDWSGYSQWFFGTHMDQPEKTKAHYGYPFGKGGEVYRAALASIAARASAQGDDDISKAASALIDVIDAKNKSVKHLGGIQRAYSRLDVKAVTEDEDHYYITGLASTPTPDRLGDVVDPMGAKFALPLPLLWQHDSRQPIGTVNTAKAGKAGIPMTASIPKVKEAGTLQDRINEAVQSIKYKLVTGLSIGFQSLNNAFEFLENGGMKFNEWEWMELSVVTIPCNSEATIQTIKSLDSRQRAASGKPAVGVVRLSPGVAGKTKAGVVRLADIPLPKAEK